MPLYQNDPQTILTDENEIRVIKKTVAIHKVCLSKFLRVEFKRNFRLEKIVIFDFIVEEEKKHGAWIFFSGFENSKNRNVAIDKVTRIFLWQDQKNFWLKMMTYLSIQSCDTDKEIFSFSSQTYENSLLELSFFFYPMYVCMFEIIWGKKYFLKQCKIIYVQLTLIWYEIFVGKKCKKMYKIIHLLIFIYNRCYYFFSCKKMINLITIFGNKLDNTCNFLEKIKREIFDVKKKGFIREVDILKIF